MIWYQIDYKWNTTTVFTQFVAHIWTVAQCITIRVQITLFSTRFSCFCSGKCLKNIGSEYQVMPRSHVIGYFAGLVNTTQNTKSYKSKFLKIKVLFQLVFQHTAFSQGFSIRWDV